MPRAVSIPARFPFSRFLTFVAAAALLVSTPLFAAGRITGTVVDQTGAALTRAEVRLVDAKGKVVARGLSDDRGHFAFDAASCASGCNVDASLVGFVPAHAPATTSGDITLALAIAPLTESVVASATRSDVPESQVGATSTVFTSDDIERRGATNVTDLLKTAPGAIVVQSGGRGAVTSLFVRGGESSYNKVLLDGIPINDPGGTFNFNNLTTMNLERVEFVRGAQSALFGSDAMTSVVQLFTKRGDPSHQGPSFTFDTEGGGYGTRSAAGTLSGAKNKWDYSVNAAQYHTDNNVANNKFDNTTVTGTGGGAIGANSSLRFVARVEDGKVGTPGQTAYERADSDAYYKGRTLIGGVTFETHHAGITQHASYGLTSTREISADLVLDPPYTPMYQNSVAPFQFTDFLFNTENDFRRHHASYQLDANVGPKSGRFTQILTTALDWDGERGALKDVLNKTVVNASRNNYGVTLQDQIISGGLFLTVGARFEHNENFGNATTPRLSVAYLLHSASGSTSVGVTKLKFNAGAGIKEPTLAQSFSPSPFSLGNPALKPERSRSFDGGIEQWFAHDRLKIEAVGFYGRYRDQIATETTNFTTFASEYFNIGLTQAKGLEFQADAAPVKHLHIIVSHTYTASQIVESTSTFSPVFAVGQWAFRRPRHAGFLEVAWSDKKTTIDVTGTYVGLRTDSDFSSLSPAILTNAPYWLWNAGAREHVANHTDLYVRVDNLSNSVYQEPLGYQAWGRTLSAGLTLKF